MFYMAGCNGNDVDDFLYMIIRSMESRVLRVNIFPNTLQGTLHDLEIAICGLLKFLFWDFDLFPNPRYIVNSYKIE